MHTYTNIVRKGDMKKIVYSLLVSLFVMLLIACDPVSEAKALSTPTGLALNENVLTWEAVEHASTYKVDVHGTEYSVSTTSYTIVVTEAGTYPVKVKAIGDDDYKDSEWSTPINFIVEEVPEPTIYKIEEEFNALSDADTWNLGPITNMLEVKDGQMTLTHTGVTQYPSKGKTMRVTLSKFPYLAVRVSDIGGVNPYWSIKIKLPEDETPSRNLTPEFSTTGQFFFDLTKVPGLEDKDDVVFDLYIYIVENQGSYVSFDYIRSVDEIPTSNGFGSTEGITTSNATIKAADGVMTVEQVNSESKGKITFDLVFDFELAHMIDLFVSALDDDASFDMLIDGVKVIDGATRFGHFGIDASAFDLTGKGAKTVEILVEGSVTFDDLRSNYYTSYTQTFENFDDETIYDGLELEGSADVSINNGNLSIQKLEHLTGQAIVRLKGTTNLSTYPKFNMVVTDVSDGSELVVSVAGRTIATITTPGTYNFDMTSIYASGLTTLYVNLEVKHATSGSVEIKSFGFERDEMMSQDALPVKGESVEQEGSLVEEGNNSDNWKGNAHVISRNGQIWIINSGDYSKGEVFARQLDLLENRYLNIKIDELTDQTNWKIDLVINVGLPGEYSVGLQPSISETGVFTYDLYDILNLTDSNKVIERMSVSIFVDWGAGKIVKIDYLRIEDTPAQVNEIINVTPHDDLFVSVDQDVDVSASLKFDLGNVNITIKDELGHDVTSSVLLDGVFSTDKEGLYTITYQFEGVLDVVRTIQVTSEPVIVTENQTTTITYDQSILIKATVLPDTGESLSYAVMQNEIDVTDDVFTLNDDGYVFKAQNTGSYEVTISYPEANDIVFTINVTTGWVAESAGNNSNKVEDGILIFEYSGGHYWPNHMRTFTVTPDKPFVVISSKSMTGGTWKLDIDGLQNDAIPEGAHVGTRILDLRSFLEGKDSISATFKLLIVGSDLRLELDTFEFVSLDVIEAQYNAIVDVLPTQNLTIAIDQDVELSAAFKYPTEEKTIQIKVLNSLEEDVTDEVLTNNLFNTNAPGVYKVLFESGGVTSVERIITVQSAEKPIISSSNPQNQSYVVGTSIDIDISISNQTPGLNVSVELFRNGTQISMDGLLDFETQVFLPVDSGNYEIVFAYPNADDFSLNIIVVTGWEQENISGGTTSSSLEDGVLTFNYLGEFYWPRFKKTLNTIIDETPYLVIHIDDIQGGTWKLDFGDPYTQSIVSEGTTTGEIVIDLRTYAAGSGYGETHRELPLVFAFFVVGNSVEINISQFKLVTAAEVES